ncbi:hypothetical protein MJO29_001936 [Puccinia striiformis f. sp. tritici]|uniref:hypothetical protein n=1 Tax=Puccinia striiformis f. sp. tritici TaxID=168172 RepID=UPI0020079499|nr:hypothetical protein Pst134EA_002896 [Puccinia striiformis f. sp. tritici]KAH9472273.1 hypothetical protein Pst134EA_002896 [Puccinia striiformis f. sp. tritici]KAI7966188.1 hypothetical protein MJO29_001936 [Puccinia striiformis f. sp. tritici]
MAEQPRSKVLSDLDKIIGLFHKVFPKTNKPLPAVPATPPRPRPASAYYSNNNSQQQPAIAFPIPQPTGYKQTDTSHAHSVPTRPPITIDLTSDDHSTSYTNNDTPPKTPPRKKKSSHKLTTDSSPGGGTTGLLCAGTTKQGKPCTRRPTKNYLIEGISDRFDAIDHQISTSDDHPDHHHQDGSFKDSTLAQIPRFCHQHISSVQSQSGSFFANSKWIEYSEWINEELPELVKISIKTEMSKIPKESDSQQLGYLYCHEMRPTNEANTTTAEEEEELTWIKVGRSIRPVARLSEWRTQCKSKDPIVRAFFPSSSTIDSSSENDTSYINGAQTVCSNGIKYHRKWERLVLLELSGWASIHSHSGTLSKIVCPDCKKIHTEIFQLRKGSYEVLVKPLIEKWMEWCKIAYL